jgi:hypothetical protein
MVARKSNQLPWPAPLELSVKPKTCGGSGHCDIGLPLTIPSGEPGSGAGIGDFEVMLERAELSLRLNRRKLVSGRGPPDAFSDRPPNADSTFGESGAMGPATIVATGDGVAAAEIRGKFPMKLPAGEYTASG